MTAPNLRSPTVITGKTKTGTLTTTLGPILENSPSSNKALKVNTIKVTNTTNSAAAFDISFYRESTHSYFSKNADAPPEGSYLAVDKNEYIYLEEGDSLYMKSSTALAIDYIIIYEEIS